MGHYLWEIVLFREGIISHKIRSLLIKEKAKLIRKGEAAVAKKRIDIREKRRTFEDGFRILQGEQEYVSYQSRSSIRIWHSEDSNQYNRHYHSAVEIILTLEGEVTMEVGNSVTHVGKNQILILPPDYPHSLAMKEGSKRLLFLFEPMLLMNMRDLAHFATALSKPILLEEDTPMRGEITELLLKIYEVYKTHASMWNSRCYSYLLQMYALLCEDFLHEIPEENLIGPIDPEIMNSAMNYIRRNYMNPLSLLQVANFVGFSRFYFSRAFKQFTGISFTSFLVQIRLSMAEKALIFTDKSVKAIAFESGFSSIATFNRVFREYKKCSPTQYRSIYSERATGGSAKRTEKKEATV